jgi:hypothetical protein
VVCLAAEILSLAARLALSLLARSAATGSGGGAHWARTDENHNENRGGRGVVFTG